jgi:glyoxylate reductase
VSPPRVVVTRRIPEEGLDLLRPHAELVVEPADLRAAMPEAVGLLVASHTKVDVPLLDAAPRLKVVANFGVGVDHVDVPACTARGVWVSNTAGSLTETVAELGWALLLAAARRVAEGDRVVRGGRWEGVGPFFFLGTELWGKTLGIVGAGRIGQAVGRRAAAFGMRALYWKRGERLDELLRESDALLLTVGLNAETRHLIGERELGLMKPTAFLVNIARGPVVDEAALGRALLDKRIAGAGLDVFEDEPRVHPDVLRAENVVLTPHIGSATLETRRRMARMSAENCLAGIRGERPPLAVNDVTK